MSDSKILLTYKDENDQYNVESVWATREGDYYKIDNIPFLASNIALNDVVAVEEEAGALYFDKLIKASGHTTIQVIFFDENMIGQFQEKIQMLGCTWEGSHIKNLISVDVPKEVRYSLVKEYLDQGEKADQWSYKEACLSHKY